jgi:hypothetical protein
MERRKNHVTPGKRSWTDHYFDLALWGRSLLVGAVATSVMLSMDETAHLFGYPWFYERAGEDAIQGFLIACVVFWLSRLREQRVDRRMKEIGFLNHNIRNAMQTIELAASGIQDPEQRVAVIDVSVRRVIDTLCRINRADDELSLEKDLQYAV